MGVVESRSSHVLTWAWTLVRREGRVGRLGRVSALALATALAAQVSIPIGTVPITLQTLAVVLAGLWLSPAEAAGAMLLYLAAGLAGVPVFAAAHGGYTWGYLVGFVLGAPVVSIVGRGCPARIGRLLAASLSGMGVVYVCGLGWLTAVLGDPHAALACGFYPFLLPEVMKAGVAVSAVRAVRGAREWSRAARGPGRGGC